MALYINGNKIGGGGGNSNMQELTQEEYDELTTEEKNNGTVYYITDVNGDGESFQPIIYSENEREVGVWVDGKPLYEKTVIFEGTFLGSTTIGNLNISNVDFLNIIMCSGHSVDNTYRTFSFAHSDASNNVGIFIKSNGDVEIRAGSSVTSEYAYDKIAITVRYTKTTDTAGSGTWTPQGVPTVHYSTDEQIVGTWIDGNTIYEKTYSELFLNCDNANTWYSISVNWGNIDKIVSSHIIDQYGQSIAGTVGNITVSSEKEIALNLAMNNRTIEDVTIRYTKATS